LQFRELLEHCRGNVRDLIALKHKAMGEMLLHDRQQLLRQSLGIVLNRRDIEHAYHYAIRTSLHAQILQPISDERRHTPSLLKKSAKKETETPPSNLLGRRLLPVQRAWGKPSCPDRKNGQPGCVLNVAALSHSNTLEFKASFREILKISGQVGVAMLVLVGPVRSREQ
jgi:hypothetical protein